MIFDRATFFWGLRDDNWWFGKSYGLGWRCLYHFFPRIIRPNSYTEESGWKTSITHWTGVSGRPGGRFLAGFGEYSPSRRWMRNLLDDLEALLIQADVGVETSELAIEALRQRVPG